jgi:hypothetical protein
MTELTPPSCRNSAPIWLISKTKCRGYRLEGRPVVGVNRCFGLTVELGGLIAAPMTNAATILIARRRRTIAVWADVSI